MTFTTNRFHDVHGTPADSTVGKVRDHMHPWVQEFIRHSPFAVLSTADAEGNCDASPKGGEPGFVKVLDDRHLILPDVKGNRLFQSYENLDANPHVALCFLIPGLAHSARVNGSAETVDLTALEEREVTAQVYNPDDRAALEQGLLITVDEAYGQCPRALKFSDLWDVDTIAANRAASPISTKPPGV
ncbi:MAG TPA: pyridoxamine 5'-phosphate oxidase family protein [Actinobacteria bacterium]|nr:pyridoxamine 5'-phosphate oxidase family protein [Actinomycetota bacterium]